MSSRSPVPPAAACGQSVPLHIYSRPFDPVTHNAFTQFIYASGNSANWVTFLSAESLRDAEQLLRGQLGSSGVGLAVFDDQFIYVAINQRLADMACMSPQDILGKRVQEVAQCSPEITVKVEQNLERVLATAKPIPSVEISGKLKARPDVGHWIADFLPVQDSLGKVRQVVVVATEITALKVMEDNLRHVTRELQQEKNRLEMILQVNKALAANLDVQHLFPAISGYIRQVVKQDYASIAIYDEASDALQMYALDFPVAKRIIGPNTFVPVKGGTAGRAFTEGVVKLFNREDLTANRTAFIDRLLDHGITSLCCIPLAAGSRVLGTLNLGSISDKPFNPGDIELLKQVSAQIAMILENNRAKDQIELLKRQLEQEKLYLEDEIRSELNLEDIVGESPAFRRVLAEARTVAPLDSTVLILGETGTGKELIARAIYRMSLRSDKTFIKVNCAAIPTGLLESELFGHEKGAFTGAINQKIGRMELADKGTFFLDEVGEIPLELQPKLLRALQDQEFERLGSNRTQHVNTRVIAATNRDLNKSVNEGRFRNDLFYRLNVFPIHVPPLRERTHDIPMLVRYFVQKISRRMNKHIDTIPTETMNALVNWHWPGNVRELENVIERSIILTPGPVLQVRIVELNPALSEDGPQNVLERMEREQIIRILRETGGVIAGPRGAAIRLGLKRTTLQSRIQKLGISRSEYES
jgi:formate hydrogenlyase transcriptional activator